MEGSTSTVRTHSAQAIAASYDRAGMSGAWHRPCPLCRDSDFPSTTVPKGPVRGLSPQRGVGTVLLQWPCPRARPRAWPRRSCRGFEPGDEEAGCAVAVREREDELRAPRVDEPGPFVAERLPPPARGRGAGLRLP